MRALVVEDDAPLRSVLVRGLTENGYAVDAVTDGDQALAFLREYDYAVIVLDWRMPKMSGVDVLRHMRRAGDWTPVLMLTARDSTADRVAGLNQGADDYLVKPFDFAELLARLQALQRRPATTLVPQIVRGRLLLDTTTREVMKDGEPLMLTATEFGLLELLFRRAPSLVTRRDIAVQVWGNEADAVGSNTIDVHIARLRAKVAGGGARIETVRSSGYRLVAE